MIQPFSIPVKPITLTEAAADATGTLRRSTKALTPVNTVQDQESLPSSGENPKKQIHERTTRRRPSKPIGELSPSSIKSMKFQRFVFKMKFSRAEIPEHLWALITDFSIPLKPMTLEDAQAVCAAENMVETTLRPVYGVD
ncbi:hypothetical protein L596_013318 [Steinernema carpocapsae]|uniref:Uncharacterized protein n=1 Tax=Steinernema carpocapsae TaxID=34508 RepID=A0A4U5NZV0_STECR|nr:hypothetical protein L596_013318 [Steinernema carpocapsae]